MIIFYNIALSMVLLMALNIGQSVAIFKNRATVYINK